MKILVTPTSIKKSSESEAMEKLRTFSDDLVFNSTGRPLTEDELIPLLKDCDAYLAGLDYITKRVLNECPHLKMISRYGVGYDRIDIPAATEKGVIVTNTPGANSEAVGELTFALLLAVIRKIPYLDKKTREGQWVRSTGIELKGRTIGILGLGAVGKVVARCARGFDMKVIAYDPYINKKYCEEHDITCVTLDMVIHKSDVISLHLPLDDETRYLIDDKAISKMKDGVIIINASRGGIVDEKAVCAALKSGKVGGMGLDAFEIEPPPVDSPLFDFDNVVTTPHTGAHTMEASSNMTNMAVDSLISVMSGKDCQYIVNRS